MNPYYPGKEKPLMTALRMMAMILLGGIALQAGAAPKVFVANDYGAKGDGAT